MANFGKTIKSHKRSNTRCVSCPSRVLCVCEGDGVPTLLVLVNGVPTPCPALGRGEERVGDTLCPGPGLAEGRGYPIIWSHALFPGQGVPCLSTQLGYSPPGQGQRVVRYDHCFILLTLQSIICYVLQKNLSKV